MAATLARHPAAGQRRQPNVDNTPATGPIRSTQALPDGVVHSAPPVGLTSNAQDRLAGARSIGSGP